MFIVQERWLEGIAQLLKIGAKIPILTRTHPTLMLMRKLIKSFRNKNMDPKIFKMCQMMRGFLKVR